MNTGVTFVAALFIAAAPVTALVPVYTNVWGVKIVGGLGMANSVALRHGLINLGQIGILKDIYEFILPLDKHYQIVAIGLYPQITEALLQEDSVIFAEQEVVREVATTRYTVPTDPRWPEQFYLSRDNSNLHLNVEPAWIQGFTGCRVVVAIVDDGVDFKHPDLIRNYVPPGSGFECFDLADSAFPDFGDTHGTFVAGVIGMEKSNGVCGVGVAYNSLITGILLLSGFQIDISEAKAFLHENNKIDIYSNSWGPIDNGKLVLGPGFVATIALALGAQQGRYGKGSIFIFSSGNGGENDDSCAANGYVQSIYTIGIGALLSDGRPTSYDERCSAKMASTFVNFAPNPNIATIATEMGGGCVNTFSGTSAAAPQASGSVALALEANPYLTWRDVQYLIVYTSNIDILIVDDLATNGAGLKFSHSVGFGAIDAEALVTRARYWINVPQQQFCSVDFSDSIFVGPSSTESIEVFFDDEKVAFLEHVVVEASISVILGNRGDIQLELTSPAGTVSILLPYRSLDTGPGVYFKWPFMSVHFWGENPSGNWTLTVRNRGGTGTAKINYIRFIIYGTAVVPQAIQNIPQTCDEACARGCARPGPQFCDACRQLRIAFNLTCVDECPPGLVERQGYCYDATLPEPTCPNAAEYECSHECKDYECSKGAVSKRDACYAVCLKHYKHKHHKIRPNDPYSSNM